MKKFLKTIFLLLPLATFELVIVLATFPFGYVYGLAAGGFRKGNNIAEARCMEAYESVLKKKG